ncbi:MAG: chemotaxis protein CheW, partial [Clostridiales bacterium]
MNELKIAIFELNGDTLATDVLCIKEIVKYQNIEVLEDVPLYFEGFFDYRGYMVPIINLNAKFRFGKSEATKKTKIIITITNDEYIGFVVNDVKSILNIYENEVENMPDIAHRQGKNFLKKVIKKDNDIIAILDIKQILTKDEVEFVYKLRETYLKNKIN